MVGCKHGRIDHSLIYETDQHIFFTFFIKCPTRASHQHDGKLTFYAILINFDHANAHAFAGQNTQQPSHAIIHIPLKKMISFLKRKEYYNLGE
jgi:hypothetical protein